MYPLPADRPSSAESISIPHTGSVTVAITSPFRPSCSWESCQRPMNETASHVPTPSRSAELGRVDLHPAHRIGHRRHHFPLPPLVLLGIMPASNERNGVSCTHSQPIGRQAPCRAARSLQRSPLAGPASLGFSL